MALVRDSTRMGMTVKLPDQSLWAVQSYDLTMDTTHLPRLRVELVGIRVPVHNVSPIAGLEEWIPTPLKASPTDPYGLMRLTRKQILDALTAMVEREEATVQQVAQYETTGQVSPALMDKIKAYILKQETKRKIERKDAFWKD